MFHENLHDGGRRLVPGLRAPSRSLQQISIGEMRTRYLSLNDGHGDARSAWLGSVFHFVEEFTYSVDDTCYLSSAFTDFDVLIIGGNDVRRIAPIYRRNEVALKGKLVVGLMKGSTPQRRAHLLYNGFDDVMDIEKIMPAEAVARFRGMRARQVLKRAREAEAVLSQVALSAVCDVHLLTPKERRIMSLLMEQPGKYVSLERLQTEASRTHDQITLKHLQVSISLLRRKLRGGNQIINHPEWGYALKV